jgi:hypothetical protein
MSKTWFRNPHKHRRQTVYLSSYFSDPDTLTLDLGCCWIRIKTLFKTRQHFFNWKYFLLKDRHMRFPKLQQITFSPPESSSTMKFLHLFLFLGTVLACLYPVPNRLTQIDPDLNCLSTAPMFRIRIQLGQTIRMSLSPPAPKPKILFQFKTKILHFWSNSVWIFFCTAKLRQKTKNLDVQH